MNNDYFYVVVASAANDRRLFRTDNCNVCEGDVINAMGNRPYYGFKVVSDAKMVLAGSGEAIIMEALSGGALPEITSVTRTIWTKEETDVLD